jgi:hypothetical protein
VKNILMFLLATVLICSLAACVNQAPISPLARSETPTPLSTPTIQPVTTVTIPWQPGSWQSGVQVYWHTNKDSVSIVKQKADRIFDYIVGLGANSVAISFPIYTDGPKPSRVYVDPNNTPATVELQNVIQEAQLRKLRVTIRPIIDEANIMSTRNAWRGSIVPLNKDAWLASYEQVITPYLRLATMDALPEFVLGTELASLQQSPQWQALLETARQSYSGTISWADNWLDYQGGNYGPLADIGIDAYPKFKVDNGATVEQLTALWAQWINATKPQSSSVSLQEVGIPAQNGAYANPGDWGKAHVTINQTIQANWFTAACRAAKQTGINGIYFWKIDVNTDPSLANPVTDPSPEFIGRESEVAMRQCFAI